MPAGILDIEIEQGATFKRTINVQDATGSPINLSDVTSVRGQVRKAFSSTDSYAFTLSVTNAASGIISWTMDAVTSASLPVKIIENWKYDVELVRTSEVERLLEGTVTIRPEVTK